MNTEQTEQAVKEACEPLLDNLGLELWDVNWGGGRLRLVIEREGGVNTEALTLASKTISAELDALDLPGGGRYTLEVSSPGLERKLRKPEHFRRAVGCEVALKLLPGGEGERRVRGFLDEVDEGQVTVLKPDGGRAVIPLASVSAAKTVINWERNPSRSEVRR